MDVRHKTVGETERVLGKVFRRFRFEILRSFFIIVPSITPLCMVRHDGDHFEDDPLGSSSLQFRAMVMRLGFSCLSRKTGLKIRRLDANLAVVETRDQFPPHLPIISYVLTIFCTFFSVRYPTIHGRTPPPSQTAGCTRPSLCVRLDSVRSMSRNVRHRPTCMDQRFS